MRQDLPPSTSAGPLSGSGRPLPGVGKTLSAAFATARDRQRFLESLREWQGKPIGAFPRSYAPCCSVGSDDEDAILAGIFALIASDWPFFTPGYWQGILAGQIAVHERRYQTLLDAARGQNTGPKVSRVTWIETRPYKDMLQVLYAWSEAIHDEMLGSIWGRG